MITTNLKNRIIAGIIMIPLFIIPILLGNWILVIGLIYLLLQSLYEFYTISHQIANKKFVIVGSLFGVSVIIIRYSLPTYFSLIITLSILVSIVFFRFMKRDDFNNWLVIIIGAFYIGFFLSFAANIRELANGKEWLITILVVAASTDVFSYFIGKRFGRTKLAPRTSPGKTWEGFVGGLTVSVIVSVLLCNYFNLTNIFLSIVLGVVIALADLLGDLFCSMIKRTYGVKDFGSWILKDAHGGLLDRIDGWLVVLPISFYLINYLIIPYKRFL